MHAFALMRWCQLAIGLIIAQAAVNQFNFLPQTTSDNQRRQHLIDHVSLILCHLNVKSIYLYFENTLRTNIVENLLRDTNFCDPPIVTLIKLVYWEKSFYTFRFSLAFFLDFGFAIGENVLLPIYWRLICIDMCVCLLWMYVFFCADHRFWIAFAVYLISC